MKDELELTLKRLKDFENSILPILSVFLGYNEKSGSTAALLISELHSMVHQNLSQTEQQIFKDDLTKIENYLKEFYNRKAKRSQVFFSAGKKLWEVLDFEFYLPPIVLVSYSPYTRPITEAIQKYKKYLVLLVDREKGRLLTVRLGKIEDEKQIFDGQVPQRVRAKTINWGRTDKIMRHIEDHLHNHLKIITKEAKDFAADKDISFILLGGHKEVFHKLKKVLPYPLNKMVIGEFVTDVNLPVSDILIKSKSVISALS